jgi:hypothetical protein
MSKYNFRIRFNFTAGDHIDSDETELLLFETADGQRIQLRAAASGRSLKEFSRAAIVGGQYLTKEAAGKAALITKEAVISWALHQRFGVDFGDGRLRGLLTNEGIKHFEDQLGRPVRNDLHGIDIYEWQE